MYISTTRSRVSNKNFANRQSILNKKQIQREIKKERKRQTGVSDCTINCLLARLPNFIGCFAQNQLESLIIRSLPVCLIVNFDNITVAGSHWIALRIERKFLEVFDPLGFNINRWPKIPHFLLQFIHKFAQHRRVRISKEIQPLNSSLCGFYCIFFLYYRLSHTFYSCTNHFSLVDLHNNDLILYSLFN